MPFTIEHDEIETRNPFCVIAKDGLRINLFENTELAAEHHPEFRLIIDDTAIVYSKVSALHRHLLHPNLSHVTLRPEGTKEFTVSSEWRFTNGREKSRRSWNRKSTDEIEPDRGGAQGAGSNSLPP